MPANSRWYLIQRYKVKIVKNPGNGHLNNLNDPILNVLRRILLHGIGEFVATCHVETIKIEIHRI